MVSQTVRFKETDRLLLLQEMISIVLPFLEVLAQTRFRIETRSSSTGVRIPSRASQRSLANSQNMVNVKIVCSQNMFLTFRDSSTCPTTAQSAI
jgi:regulator of protease activity HflC (stomatin/prohibitin superfamily)